MREDMENSQNENSLQIGLISNQDRRRQQTQMEIRDQYDNYENSNILLSKNKNSELDEIFGEFLKTDNEEYDPNYPNDYTKVN
jgi:hypothetical protein